MARTLSVTLLLALVSPVAAQAQGFQSTALLDQAVAQFTGKPIGSDGGAAAAVDRRLKLAQCPLPQMEWRSDRQDAVVVRCMTPVWRIYVPVRRAAPATSTAPVGTTRTIAQKAEPVIRRGDPITVEAGSAGFAITRDGIAMGDAAPGARLLVKVDAAKPPIQAVAVEQGRARLPGWDG